MTEVMPSTAWAQRWRDGRHSWRPRSEGGFDRRRYEVTELAYNVARPFVEKHHYSRTWPSVSLAYGLYERDELVGVLTLGTPQHLNVVTNVFPDLGLYARTEGRPGAADLSRLVLLDRCPANSESFFVAEAFRLAAHHDVPVQGVVSMSDPVPRVVGGELLFPGHIGVVYQALNAHYLGRTARRTKKYLPDGTVLDERIMSKVRNQERGHEYVERRLIEWGAPAPKAGESPRLWLPRALDAVKITRARHSGQHRYAWPLGRTKSERARVRIAGQAGFYPKEVDREAIAV